MEKKFNSVFYKTVKYLNNTSSGKYEKQPLKIDFARLPFELWIEETREERFIQQGADEIITGRIQNKTRLFYTGLRPIIEGFYYGDDYKKSKGAMKKSLCVFAFSSDYKELTIYYFNNYYISRKETRELFILSFINSLKG